MSWTAAATSRGREASKDSIAKSVVPELCRPEGLSSEWAWRAVAQRRPKILSSLLRTEHDQTPSNNGSIREKISAGSFWVGFEGSEPA